ncbi:hypothetical protein KAU51_04245 [Candidatus Parcubacteria bacterium]|nr:hypothetical protein [Candidatus Parcubacteria bacterium]
MKSETDYNLTDRFFEAFNSSRCKTAMLALSIILVLGYVVTIFIQVPSEELKTIVIIVIGYWIGKTAKNRDKNMTFNEYKMVKLVKKVLDEEKR